MNLKRSWSRFWNWCTSWRRGRSKSKYSDVELREFIYLDEISVVSLLVSRDGEVTEQIQEGAVREEQAQLDSTAGVGVQGLKAESKSSYQTKNSQSVQTTRKANIQSHFRKFLELAEKDGLVFPKAYSGRDAKGRDELVNNSDLCRSEDKLTRGTLVELKVVLEADPIYRVGSIISEFASMGDEHPEIFRRIGGLVPSNIRSAGKLLDRFMAGLIPIRSVVKNVRLFEHGGCRYLVDTAAATAAGLDTSEVELVGVSEKDSYWKDIRRVLFSKAEVTVLARLNATGIQSSWRPVKLADLFESLIPGTADQISALARMDISPASTQPNSHAEAFQRALTFFADAASNEIGQQLTGDRKTEINALAETLRDYVVDTEKQRQAFSRITHKLQEFDISIDPKIIVRLRREARQQAGLPQFLDGNNTMPSSAAAPTEENSATLLEVEIIAMYW